MFGFGRHKSLLERIDRLEREIAEIWQPIYLGDHVAITKLRHTGQIAFVDTRDRTMVPHLLMRGLWEEWAVKAFLAELRPGMTALDVGANFGAFALPAAAAVGPSGKIFAIEANADYARLLRHSAGLNGFGNLVVIPIAAYKERCEMMLNFAPEEGGGGSIVRDRNDPFWGYGNFPVQADRLDSMIPAGTRIDVVKMDIEDGEIHAFEGMGELLDHPHAIFTEIYAPGLARFKPCDAYLEDFRRRGFGLYHVASDGTSGPHSPSEILARVGDRVETLMFKR